MIDFWTAFAKVWPQAVGFAGDDAGDGDKRPLVGMDQTNFFAAHFGRKSQ